MLGGTGLRRARRVGARRIASVPALALALALAATGTAAGAETPEPRLPAVAALPTTPASRSLCWPANKLLVAGLLGDAEAKYHSIASRAPRTARPVGCAQVGLRHVAEARRRRTGALARAGRAARLDEATIVRLVAAARGGVRAESYPRVVARGISREQGAYGVAIALALHRGRHDREAASVLSATLDRFPRVDVPVALQGIARRGLAIKEAQALSRAGFDEDAAAKVRDALRADPTVEVPAELTDPDHRAHWWNTFRGQVGPWVRSLVEIALAVLIGLFAAWAVVKLGRRWRGRVLSIEAFRAAEEAQGATTAASVRENYRRMVMRDGGDRLKLVDSSGERFEGLPEGVTDVAAQARFVDAVLALLDRFLPTGAWRATGELQPADPERGVGLRLALTRRRGGVFSERILWENDYGPWEAPANGATQEHYDRLAAPAAAWLMYATGTWRVVRSDRVFRVLGPAWRHFATGSWHPPSGFRALGTAEWRSYALFAVGANVHDRGQPDVARYRYQRALGVDADNRGALLNLAVADTQAAGDGKARARAHRELAALCHALRGRSDDPMWYRAHYACAVAHLLSDGRAADARRCAAALSAAIARRLDPGRRRPPRPLEDFLRKVQPAALLLLASALRAEGRSPRALSDVQEPLDTCLTRASLPEALETLVETERVEDGPSHTDVVGLVQRGTLRPDALYNLACYYVRVDALELAEDKLHEAFERGDAALRNQALADPKVLELWERSPEAAGRSRELLERLDPPPPEAAEPGGEGGELALELTGLLKPSNGSS